MSGFSWNLKDFNNDIYMKELRSKVIGICVLVMMLSMALGFAIGYSFKQKAPIEHYDFSSIEIVKDGDVGGQAELIDDINDIPVGSRDRGRVVRWNYMERDGIFEVRYEDGTIIRYSTN